MSEKLSSADRDFALKREAAFMRTKQHIARTLVAAPDRDKVTGPAQRYVDEHEMSDDPDHQGRVDAYVHFLRSIGRLTN